MIHLNLLNTQAKVGNDLFLKCLKYFDLSFLMILYLI